MLLLMLLGIGSIAPPAGPQRAYAAINYSLIDGSAIALTLVNSGGISISDTTDAEGSVS